MFTVPLIPESEGQRILLVEDNPELLQLAQEMLQRLGYFVLSATNPMEALKIIENAEVDIDLLITDVVMPGMNGRELAQKLTVSFPALKVLFISGYTADIIVHHGVLDSDIHFMQKPYNSKDLAVKIREVLESN